MQRLRPVLLLLSLALGWTACSHGGTNQSTSNSPVAPGPSGSASAPQLLNRPLDFSFPPRNEPLDFRNQLEARYRDILRRTAIQTFVDIEGDIVWMQEYIRYRVNGCDHTTAITKVLSIIDGGATPAVCSTPLAVSFPPRNDDLNFRQQLETKYQTGLRRNATSTFVDLEGDAVWTQEYLRYRVNACDHPTSVTNVFAQIAGGAAPPVCACVFAVSPTTQTVNASGGTFSFNLSRTSGSCAWTATSSSFISMPSTSGADPTTVTYTVAANTGAARTGTITVAWTGGSATVTISQAAPPLAAVFDMIDPSAQGSSPTTECRIRGAVSGQATVCTVRSQSFSLSTASIVNWAWTVNYSTDVDVTVTQSGSNPNFNFSDVCGGAAATDDGNAKALSVQLTVTDAQGNVATAISGQGTQPALLIRFWNCGK